MYFKLALKNVKKSYKDYLIYFLTLAFSVCLFYSFNSFQEQQAVLEMNNAQFSLMSGITSIMQMLSVMVAIILGFLILYANNFLIKRRKKELGLYTLLGMPKRHISMILVYETFIIGCISLVVGLILGLFLSQLLTVFTANLFETTLHYHFIFSMEATILTILSFSIIFIISIIFNTLNLNKYKLIDLLNANRQNEKLKAKNIYVSVILFILSVLLLGGDYYYAWIHPIEAFTFYIVPITIIGCIGTILFFMSLSGFLLKFIQTSKFLYYKKLNMFVLRQINANINSNFLSMSVVCIMLLLSIGALATGLNINQTLNNTIQMSSPYDYSFMPHTMGGKDDYTKNFEEKIKNLPLDTTDIQEQFFLHQYWDGSNITEVFDSLEMQGVLISKEDLKETPITLIKVSQFNQLLSKFDKEPLVLSNNETYVYSNQGMVKDAVHDFLTSKRTLDFYDTVVTPINTKYNEYSLATTITTGLNILVCVVNDEIIPASAPSFNTYWNVDLKEGVDEYAFETSLNQKIEAYNNTVKDEDREQILGSSTTAIGVKENSKGLSVVFTYVGIYLGIVFLMASAVILALQQLSQASDNQKRYLILDKLGTSQAMMNRSLLDQLGIYFFMPLCLAIIHSIVSIRVVNSIVMFMGSGDIFGSSIITAGIIIFVYGAYFMVTYVGYKNILNQK